MSAQTRARFLGVYLLLCVVYQMAFYFFPGLAPNPTTISTKYYMIPWIEYANPRAALGLMGDAAFHVAYLISAVWLFLLAVTILWPLSQRMALQVYLVLEGMLAIATIFFLIASFLFVFSPIRNAFLQVQIVVFICFSVLPFAFAASILNSMAQSRWKQSAG